MKKFKKIVLGFFILITISVFLISCYLMFPRKYKTYVSPDGDYKLENYIILTPIQVLFGGKNEDMSMIAILKNKNNKIIHISNKFIFTDLEPEWGCSVSIGRSFILDLPDKCDDSIFMLLEE